MGHRRKSEQRTVQDFIITVQTAGGFTIGAGNNSTPSVPTPSATIATSGRYRFIESFATNEMTGNVEATLSIVDDATTTAVPGANWVIPVVFNGNAVPAASVDGPAYGWFPNENIPELPIDNSSLHRGQRGHIRRQGRQTPVVSQTISYARRLHRRA